MANPPPSGSKPVSFSGGDSEDDQQRKPPQTACSLCSAPLGNDGGTYVHQGNLFCSEVCRQKRILMDEVTEKILNDPLLAPFLRQPVTDDKTTSSKTVGTAMASTSSSVPDPIPEACHLCNAPIVFKIEKPQFKGHHFCSEACRRSQQLMDAIQEGYSKVMSTVPQPKLDDDEDGGASSSDETAGEVTN